MLGTSIRRRCHLGVALTVSVGLLLSACGDDDVEAIVADREAGPGFEVFTSAAAQQGSLRGTLALEGTCFMLEVEGEQTPIVWPAGTSAITSRPAGVSLPDGTRARVDDYLDGQGTRIAASRYREGGEFEQAVLDCPGGATEIVTFDRDGDVTVTR